MITQTGMLYPSCVVELRTDLRSIKVSKEERRGLVKVNKMILKNLGHEVKPLGGIRGAAQLLKDELVENELVEYTDVIIKESDRLLISWTICLYLKTGNKIRTKTFTS